MKIEVSIGELVDKVTILSIKMQKVTDEQKLVNIRKEYDTLRASMEAAGITIDPSDLESLRAVNLVLWDIEDRIRIKESQKEFDDEFVQLARSVYIQNDRRFELKRKINLSHDSELMEEKQYVNYKRG